MGDSVNHPDHYTQHPSGVECIQITEHMNFNVGNAVKYLWRADLKNGIEDLEKAAWYISREIERRKRELPTQQDSKSVLPGQRTLQRLPSGPCSCGEAQLADDVLLWDDNSGVRHMRALRPCHRLERLEKL